MRSKSSWVFFYLDHLEPLTYANSIEVLKLAKRYEVGGCFDAISKFMQTHLNSDTVCDTLTVARLFAQEMKPLVDLCHKFITDNLIAVLNSPSYLRCTPDTLKIILEISNKDTYGAINIFFASMKWASSACERKKINKDVSKNLRHQLGDCFNLISFEKMQLDEFSNCLMMFSNLFDVPELEKIIIAIAKNTTQPPK